jgi:hypothetical protein
VGSSGRLYNGAHIDRAQDFPVGGALDESANSEGYGETRWVKGGKEGKAVQVAAAINSVQRQIAGYVPGNYSIVSEPFTLDD